MSSTPPPPPGATPPPATDAPAQWDTQPSSGGGSGNRRALLIIGIGVLGLIVGVVAVISLGGDDDDDDGRASGEGIEQSVPDLRRQTPGTFDPGAPIPVTLEEGDVSFLLTAVADDPISFVAITEVKDPDGEVIYSLSEDGAVSGELAPRSSQARTAGR